jgi:uncharacterized protein YodC (DUF2158 family)
MTLQVGEVVRLKSGGPAMTVMATGARAEPGVVECAWFSRDHAYATASFPPRALERATLAEPAVRPVLAVSGTAAGAS